MSWIDFLDLTCGGERLREAKLKRLKGETMKKASTERIEDERIIIEALAER